MKKLLIALGLGALLMGTSALANGNKGAIVINEDGSQGNCSAYMDVDGYGLLYLIGTDVHVVINKHMMKTVCKLDIPDWVPVGPESAVVIKDFECDLYPSGDGNDNPPLWCEWWPSHPSCVDNRVPLEATDSQFVWTPDNEATLKCSWKARTPRGKIVARP